MLTDWITGIGTGVLAIITIVYAIINHKILKLNREQNKLSQRAVLFPNFDRRSEEYLSIIANRGIDDSFELSVWDENMTDFKNGKCIITNITGSTAIDIEVSIYILFKDKKGYDKRMDYKIVPRKIECILPDKNNARFVYLGLDGEKIMSFENFASIIMNNP